MTIKRAVYDNFKPLVAPALILTAIDYATGKNYDTWHVATDVGTLAFSQWITKYVVDMLPDGMNNSLYDNTQKFVILPAVASLLYEYIYGKSIRNNYGSDFIRGPWENYVVASSSIAGGQLLAEKILCWLL